MARADISEFMAGYVAPPHLPKLKESVMRKYRCSLKCSHCLAPMTWAMAKVQYARMLERGVTTEKAKTVSPCCKKCFAALTTDWRRAHPLSAAGERRQ